MLRARPPALLFAVCAACQCGNPLDSFDAGGTPDASISTSRVTHLVVIVQENHSFDSYFGHYCTAAAGSNPTCTTGPACCEGAPDHEPGASMASPVALTDSENATFNPPHDAACETLEINSGAMDRFVMGTACSDPRNFAVATEAAVQRYWDLAATGALADRYFQPVIGASSSNDMYLARAAFVFSDNAYGPDSVGNHCSPRATQDFTETTIADLLDATGVPWAFYAEGYDAMKAAEATDGGCPPPPAGCPAGSDQYPCTFSGGDVPFEYYPRLRDDPAHILDYRRFADDLDAGTFPAVAFVKALGYRTEHPGGGDTITAGAAFVDGVLAAVAGSSASAQTLTLLVYDESGGYFDHVAPPPTNTADNKPYGPRVPLLALGPFARANTVSHVTLEHSSIVRFIEWNWFGGVTGQLGTRDANVHNLGSLIDPAASGTPVPED
jgi:phospholipase C